MTNKHRGSVFDPDEMGVGLGFHIAQLRHAYAHLMTERVIDHRRFADGLIAPAIEYFERLREPAK
jgi:hypothetical protein